MRFDKVTIGVTPAYKTKVSDEPLAIKRLVYWINERQKVHDMRERELMRPWTFDPILQKFKFCNVHREDDRVTEWIRYNWREPNYYDKNAWFTMAVARYINWPDTLEEIGYPKRWDPEKITTILRARQARKEKVFTGAYMITNGGSNAPKIDTVVRMLDNLRKCNSPPVKGDPLEIAFEKLRAVKNAGMGSFMVGQIIADCKHMELFVDSEDWYDWACPGPGSLRGLQRLTTQKVKESTFIDCLIQLRHDIEPQLKDNVGRLCLQDLQNCLCEFDKYERTLWGEGRPRSTYTYTGPKRQEELF